MALDLKKKAPRERSANNGNSGTQNVLMIMGKREKEHAVATLVTDSFGLAAGTEVSLVLREINQDGKKKKRPEIKDFKAGQKLGSSPVIGEELVIVAQNAYLDNKNSVDGRPTVNARWINVGIHDYANQGASNVAPGYVSVAPLWENKRGDETFYSQVHHIVNPDEAFAITSFDDFKARAIELLSEEITPQIIVRITNSAAVLSGEVSEDDATVEVNRLRLSWDPVAKAMRSPEDSFEYFLDGPAQDKDGNQPEDFGRIRSFFEALGTDDVEGYEFDAIVDRTLGVGKATVEKLLENIDAAVERAARNKGSELTDAEKRVAKSSADGSDMFYEGGSPVYTKGVTFLKTTASDRAIATDTFPENVYAALFTEEELIGARSEEVQAKFTADAVARGQARSDRMKKGRDAAKEQTNTPEEDRYAEQPGLTPG